MLCFDDDGDIMPNLTRVVAAKVAGVLAALLDRLTPADRGWLARDVMRERQKRKSFAEFSEKVALAYANAQFDIAINGEKWLLHRMAAFAPKVMFDVGANRGEWAVAALESCSQATVHAFEIVSETYDHLKQATAVFGQRIVANNCGLSDKDGSLDVFFTPGCDVHSSFLEGAHALTGNEDYVRVSRPVRAGDGYLAEKGIAKIDVLKVDTEGAEPLVLEGFKGALAAGKVDVIQFEYGKHALITRHFLKDFYDRLQGFGFVLGKLYPDGVAFKDYAIEDENFIGPNYIACRAARGDIIEALKLR